MLLDDAMAAVLKATAPRQWGLDDLKAVIKRTIKKMKAEGLLVDKKMEELMPKPGRFRKGRGLTIAPARTAKAPASTDGGTPVSDATALDGGQLVNSPVND